MALLPEDPRDQRKMLVVIVVVAVASLYWMYVHTPRAQELAELEDRIAQLENFNRQAESRAGNADGLRAELQRAEAVLEALEELVPSEAEVSRLYDAIAAESQALGMELMNVTPSRPAAAEGQYFLRQNWAMSVQGDYHSVGSFLSRVASFPRVVRPEVSEIRPIGAQNPSETSTRMAVTLELETFVLPPDTTGAGTGGGGGDDA